MLEPGVEHDAVADGEAVDAGAERRDDAGAVRSEDPGLRHGREAHAHPHVEVVERRGGEANEHLALARLRVGHVLVPEDVRAAVLVDPDRLHGQNPLMTAAELARRAEELGLDVVGAAPAEAYDETEQHIRERARAGPLRRDEVHDGPARGLVPSRAPARRCGAHGRLGGALLLERRARTRARRGPAAAVRLARPLRAPARRGSTRSGGRSAAATACSSTRTSTSTAREHGAPGVGFYGKNTMLITREHGSWVVLGTLVTDVEIEATPPLDLDCGRCTLCIDACPTGALDEPGVLDANRCLSYWTQAPAPVPEALPRGARRVRLRLRHLPGRVPVEPRRREAAPRPAARRGRGAERLAPRLADARRGGARRGARPALRSAERPALAAAERPLRARQHRCGRCAAARRGVGRERRSRCSPTRPPGPARGSRSACDERADRLAVLAHEVRSPVAALAAIAEAYPAADDVSAAAPARARRRGGGGPRAAPRRRRGRARSGSSGSTSAGSRATPPRRRPSAARSSSPRPRTASSWTATPTGCGRRSTT